MSQFDRNAKTQHRCEVEDFGSKEGDSQIQRSGRGSLLRTDHGLRRTGRVPHVRSDGGRRADCGLVRRLPHSGLHEQWDVPNSGEEGVCAGEQVVGGEVETEGALL